MIVTFEQSVAKVLDHEGGYVNDKTDRGGETNYGITIGVARANGYTKHMKDMPLHVAKEIYKKRYWNAVRADELPESIRYIVFDTGINMGISRATKILQQCAGTVIDGVIGPKTIAASCSVGLHTYALQRMYFYCQIVRRDKSQAKYIGGWSNRVMDIINMVK